MNTLSRLCLLILLVTYCPSLKATPSVRPHGVVINGIVRSVDAASRTIVFAQDDGTVRTLVWIRWAVFMQAGHETTPAHLRPGMRVALRYHNPLFGSDYFSRATLLLPNSSQTNSRRM